MAAQAAYLARLIVGGTINLHATRIQVTFRTDEFDVTTFENFSVGQYDTGIYDFDVSFDAFWDPVDNPFAFFAQDLYTSANTTLRVQYAKLAGNNPGWYFPNFLVLSSNHEIVVRDVIRYSVTGKATAFQNSDYTSIITPS